MDDVDGDNDFVGIRDRRPDCQCHGVAMTKRNDSLTGWRCSVEHQEAQWDYSLTTQGILAEQRRQIAHRKERYAEQT